MSSVLPAAMSSLVTLASSLLGARSPEGWLWTMMMPGAFAPYRLAKHFRRADGRRVHAPDKNVRRSKHVVLGVEQQHSKCSFSKSTISPDTRSATPWGELIIGRSGCAAS